MKLENEEERRGKQGESGRKLHFPTIHLFSSFLLRNAARTSGPIPVILSRFFLIALHNAPKQPTANTRGKMPGNAVSGVVLDWRTHSVRRAFHSGSVLGLRVCGPCSANADSHVGCVAWVCVGVP